MNKEDKKLQKHLVNEMMKVSKTNPDVMIYMQTLMENYEQLEQKVDRLNNIINELENKLLELRLTDVDGKTIVYRLLDKLKELKGE